MAKRENYDDLDELLAKGTELPLVSKGSIETIPHCAWFKSASSYGTDRSAASTASQLRKKLGADRVRVAARGRFVYVYFKPVEVAEAA